MKKILFILSAMLLLTAQSMSASTNPDIELLRTRLKNKIMASAVNEERVKTLIQTIQPDGTWQNIDYIDTSRIAFQHSIHLNNMTMMARAYKKQGSSLKGNKDLKKKIEAALNYWLKNDFICENWWWNQIGTPSTMVNLLYIMDKDLSKAQVTKMLEIAGRANMNASGARPGGDRVKVASLYAYKVLWERKLSEVEKILKIIEGELKFADEGQNEIRPGYFASGRGMERDFSFHHRPDRVNNTLSYGMSYAGAFLEWAIMVADTHFKFSEKSTHQFIDYYLDGCCKQMVFGIKPDPNNLNRDICRVHGKGNISDNSMPESLMKISDYRKGELEQIVKLRNGEKISASSFAKFFWQTELFVFQRPAFYTSVRMFSTRNRNMEEPYNGEGLLNHYRADGTNYLSLKGNEYDDIGPVLDYRKIPGATILQDSKMPPEDEIQKDGVMDFVGAVTDGTYGAVAFDFVSPHDPLTAKKSWFFFDDEYVCLGANIKSRSNKNVFTTVNQCYLNGSVTVGTDGNKSEIPAGEHSYNNAGWVHHDNVGYVFMNSDTKVGLLNKTVEGSWRRIARQTTTSDKVFREDIFGLWIDHGRGASDNNYAYAVLPNADVNQTAAFKSNPSVEIISNTEKIQAVRHKKLNIAYIIFYSGGTLKISDNISVSSETPVVLMIRYTGSNIEAVSVSDPSRKLLKSHISVSGNFATSNKNAKFAFDNSTGMTNITVDLPQGEYAGSSVTF